MQYLIDTSVLLDVLTDDPTWGDWAAGCLAECADRGMLVINPIVYAEVAAGFRRVEELDEALPAALFRRDPLPWEGAFLAGKAFLAYRRRGGGRLTPLPDFYIGAHAAVAGLTLVTRDVRRYRTYFPKLTIICPEERA